MNKFLIRNKKSAQAGIAHLALILLAGVGVIAYTVISSSATFKDGIFAQLYPKQDSFAAANKEGSFSNLSADLKGDSATIAFNYSGSAPKGYTVDVATSADMKKNLLRAFGQGSSSPIIVSNPQSKYAQYKCGVVIYWRINVGTSSVRSSVSSASVNCNINIGTTNSSSPTPTPTLTPTLTPTPTPTGIGSTSPGPSPTINPSPTSAPATSYRRVFITSSYYDGNLGGLSGADAKCQNAANGANLGGSWKAWLSDSTTSASSRLEHFSGSYKRIDGLIIANNWTDLTDGPLLNPQLYLGDAIQKPINIDEYGRLTPESKPYPGGGYTPALAWTATLPNGEIDTGSSGSFISSNCSNWTFSGDTSTLISGHSGQAYAINSWWTDGASGYCLSKLQLYCFEQGTLVQGVSTANLVKNNWVQNLLDWLTK